VSKSKEQLKEFSLKNSKLNLMDLFNTVVGIALIVSLILVFQNPSNRFAILAICLSGGLMNILNGLKQWKDPKRKTMGMTFFMMGAIVIALGFIIMDMI
jgi:hypothetical protein